MMETTLVKLCTVCIIMFYKIRHELVAHWLALLPHSEKVLGLISWLTKGAFPVHAWLSSGDSGFLLQSENMLLRSTGYLKGVKKSINICLEIDCRPYPTLCS